MSLCLTITLTIISLLFCVPAAVAGIAPVGPPLPPGVPEVNPSILSFIGTGITLGVYKVWKKISNR